MIKANEVQQGIDSGLMIIPNQVCMIRLSGLQVYGAAQYYTNTLLWIKAFIRNLTWIALSVYYNKGKRALFISFF